MRNVRASLLPETEMAQDALDNKVAGTALTTSCVRQVQQEWQQELGKERSEESLLLVKESTQPFGNRFSNERDLSVTALSDSSEGDGEIVVVENQDHRKCLDCGLEVCESAGKSSDQFFGRNVMSTLEHAHGNAFLRSLGTGNADKAEHDVVAGSDRVREERKPFARRIGKDGFEDEAFALFDEFASESIGDRCGLLGRHLQFARDVVSVA
jgi:hypothetical protein